MLEWGPFDQNDNSFSFRIRFFFPNQNIKKNIYINNTKKNIRFRLH